MEIHLGSKPEKSAVYQILICPTVYSASVSVSDDFVLFDSLDWNGALFANVLCEIPVLRISLIQIFGWKPSYWHS